MSLPEPRESIATFWTNLYLRGAMVFDPLGDFSADAYTQPDTVGLPASRSFVIGPDQTVAFPFFGYDPTTITNRIYRLLGHDKGDYDGDGEVDSDDIPGLTACFTGDGGFAEPGCAPVDLDDDSDVDCRDWYLLRQLWTDPVDPPRIEPCHQTVVLTVETDELRLVPAPGAIGYDVVHGDLQELRDGAGDFAFAVRGCLANDLAEGVLPYSIEVPPGAGSWFLARGVTVSTDMTYDPTADSEMLDRDAGIAGSPLACP
jgi:hypothetical protein